MKHDQRPFRPALNNFGRKESARIPDIDLIIYKAVVPASIMVRDVLMEIICNTERMVGIKKWSQLENTSGCSK